MFNKRNHFRTNNSKKVRGHPTYIYKREGDKYCFIGITHSPITHGTKNIKLYKNPNPKDINDFYFRPFSSKDYINNFGKKKKGWRLSKNDKKIVNKLKKK